MSYSFPDGLAHLPLWRAFLAVHTTGSLSAAARSMGVTQPTVSAQLQALEHLVGEQLFLRGARGVLATPRADELAARIAGPFHALASALAGDEDVTVQPAVRIGGALELLSEVVVPSLSDDVARGVRIHVTPGPTTSLVEGVRAGILDAAIVSERPRGRSVLARPFVDETFVLVASPEVARAVASRPALPAALDTTPLLAYAPDLPVLRRFWRHVFGSRLEREPSLVVPDLRALRDAAVSGAGATVLPSYLCRAALNRGDLVDLCPTDDPPINTLFTVTRHTAAERPNVQRVLGVLMGRVKEVIADEAAS
ncbi:LysR family transcriptional regulator [Microbacterium sp. CFH 31415]|uniref:LysR family transcriptional regulator n=1 Tax=Microbacterium sp. CFH 31415 TaxID=2921732 RepID=UPI001F12C0D1|nr:LysR family transcriptional regulator [Microbacterium sp. CFH 31415]MCH6230600.1 LysR family transcriptional regulator [Microbacterium sp. CFH 31415]